jgi:hypothetical protein
MSVASNVVVSTPSAEAGKRVNYGLNLLVNGATPLNEWALQPGEAELCHKVLLKNGDTPFIMPGSAIEGVEGSGILVSRRPVNKTKAGLAEMLAA